MDTASLLPLILIAAVVMALALGGMALGVMLSGKRIEGSCGGLANSNIPGHDATSPCMSCGAKPETCDRPGADQVRQAIRKESDQESVNAAG
ncbi:hypothetical protein [Alienimonas chondri]|uniref:(Na+)-NQR maturation NqrM n=1 Tax=Alienimonas chondri TaxID=2681879 RepID=A0ABX1VDZ9_9PLAN|nr:hypothetical protein [Alienimonas chondri]NNJ26307.1 hypothetical protein [Alienimonas chondri]